MEMTRERALELLRGGKEGVREWNAWRTENRYTTLPNLSGAVLTGAVLNGANLSEAKLSEAKLREADLSGAKLNDAKLSGANFSKAYLSGAHLSGAHLSGAHLSGANLSMSHLHGVNLIGAYLSGANLSGANLRRANLSAAHLFGANLSKAILDDANLSSANLHSVDFRHAYFFGATLANAKLYHASLYGARLAGAELSGARLHGANLCGAELDRVTLNSADLTRADLSSATLYSAVLNGTQMHLADFSKCRIARTVFGHTDLSSVKGLESIDHRADSTIDSQTLIASGNLPREFLEGCGVADSLIEYLPSIIGSTEPIQFYSCFISYSHQDEEFCKRLHSRLQQDGLRVWYAQEDMKAGEKIHEQIDSAIRVHDKLLLVLSEHSMESEWVKTEIYNARQREKDGEKVLFPIALCPFDAIKEWKAFDADIGKDMAREVREYFVPDFSNWKDHDSFESAYKRLLNDLKASTEKDSNDR